jgi:methionyl-tRNA formyltransferase
MSSQIKLRIGILTTLDCPILPIHFKAIQKKGFKDIIVICDTKVTKSRDIEIWRDRTGGLLGSYGLHENTAALLVSSTSPVFFVGSHNDPECIKLIKSLKLNVLINSGTPRKLSSSLISSVEFGILNVHPGVLPKYRGSSAVEWTIFNNDMIGNTVHFMDEGYDSGPIIGIEFYNFNSGESYHQIRSEIYRQSGPLMSEALEKISLGKIDILTAQKQDDSLAQYWEPIGPECMEIVMEKISPKMM